MRESYAPRLTSISRPVLLASTAAIAAVGVTCWLWAHYGATVFFETIRAGLRKRLQYFGDVLVDERRIHVDFSQSVSKLHRDWMLRRGKSVELVSRKRYRAQDDAGK